jgi:Ca2+:H+ antiporter
MTRAAAASRPRLITPANLMRALLVFVPLAVIAAFAHWRALVVFGFAALAIVPLAGLMGEATEELAARLGSGVGGLLNATFGNAAELIIALVALQRGYHDVVKASLTGSIIGNVLLVLGASILAGGIRRDHQRFDRSAAAVGSTLLALAAVALLVPAAFHFVARGKVAMGLPPARVPQLEDGLSVEMSIVLFVAYGAYLLFSLRTHRHLYRAGTHAGHEVVSQARPRRALLTLLLATAAVAGMSELLVGAVEEASHALGLTKVFVGVIVVAIIGNAAEHSTAVLMAVRNQMDLSINIAVGSSIQIALFVAPVLVFASHVLGPHPMNLVFTPFEVLAVALSVWVCNLVAQDGECNWIEGGLMLAVYLVLGIAFYFLPV